MFESLVLLCTQTVGDADTPMSIKAAADEYDLDEDVHDLIVSASPCVQETHIHTQSHAPCCTHRFTLMFGSVRATTACVAPTYPLTVMCTHQHSDTT